MSELPKPKSKPVEKRWPPLSVEEAKKEAGASTSDLDFLLSLPFKTKPAANETWATFFYKNEELDTNLIFISQSNYVGSKYNVNLVGSPQLKTWNGRTKKLDYPELGKLRNWMEKNKL